MVGSPHIAAAARRRVEMAEILLFHHAQGLTPGVISFADTLRRAGHIVHTPDLFDGRIFDTREQGVSYVAERGFGELIARGVRAAEGCRPNWSTPASRSVCSRRKCWPKPGREHAGHSSSIPACRSRNSGHLGQRGCRYKCMAWTPIRSS